MAEETYETPKITVLGEVTDMTQKHGILFDFPSGSTDLIDLQLKIGLKLDVLGLIDIS